MLLWRIFLFLLLNEVFFFQRFEIQQWPMKYQKKSTVIYRWSSGPSSTQGLFNIKRYVPYLFLYIHCWQICSNFARCMDTFNEFLFISFVKSEKQITFVWWKKKQLWSWGLENLNKPLIVPMSFNISLCVPWYSLITPGGREHSEKLKLISLKKVILLKNIVNYYHSLT